jgi:hypothetical protein
LIVSTVNSPEFADKSPHQIVPILADRGVYIASESTFYRVLRAKELLTHRHATKPATKVEKPKELIAEQPNQIWSWDITVWQPRYWDNFFISIFLLIFLVVKLSVGRFLPKKILNMPAR